MYNIYVELFLNSFGASAMFRVFLSFCILFSATVIFAAQPKVLSLQERFDKLAAQKTFGNEDISEFQALMAEEKETANLGLPRDGKNRVSSLKSETVKRSFCDSG